jgi:hypothetical protein
VTILTLEEAALILKMTKSQLYSMTRARARARMKHPLPVLRVNGNLRVSLESLQEWLRKLEEV